MLLRGARLHGPGLLLDDLAEGWGVGECGSHNGRVVHAPSETKHLSAAVTPHLGAPVEVGGPRVTQEPSSSPLFPVFPFFLFEEEAPLRASSTVRASFLPVTSQPVLG